MTERYVVAAGPVPASHVFRAVRTQMPGTLQGVTAFDVGTLHLKPGFEELSRW
jgi:hypothetical protein